MPHLSRLSDCKRGRAEGPVMHYDTVCGSRCSATPARPAVSPTILRLLRAFAEDYLVRFKTRDLLNNQRIPYVPVRLLKFSSRRKKIL